MKGNAFEYMPSHPNYEESYRLYKETDYFSSENNFANMREVAIGKTTIYYRNIATKIKGYEKCPYTKCKQTKGYKELKEYIFQCIENGIMQTNVYVIEDDFYETNSLQDAKTYINKCISKNVKNINLYLKLNEFNSKDMTDNEKKNIINTMINETDIRSNDPEHIGYMYAYRIRVFGDIARVTMSKCGT